MERRAFRAACLNQARPDMYYARIREFHEQLATAFCGAACPKSYELANVNSSINV